MVYCRICGSELEGSANFCAKCGSNQNEFLIGIDNKVSKKWYVVAFFIPLIGLIASVIFAIQHRKGAFKLLAFTVIWWIIVSIISLSILAGA